jgi:uracil-DNA glycosylase family 4
MMAVGGMGKRKILVVAEAPGGEEDAAYAEELWLAADEGREPVGTQLIGAAGRRLAKELRRHDIDLYEDCWLINACSCRPPRNRTPTTNEIVACRPRVLEAIESLRPKFILVLGAVGLESLLGHRWHAGEGSLGGITQWRGWQAPDQELGAWVCPTFHPSYVLRCERSNDPQIGLYFGLDIEQFAALVNKPKP